MVYTDNVLEDNCCNFNNSMVVATEMVRGCRLHPKDPLRVKLPQADLFIAISGSHGTNQNDLLTSPRYTVIQSGTIMKSIVSPTNLRWRPQCNFFENLKKIADITQILCKCDSFGVTDVVTHDP